MDPKEKIIDELIKDISHIRNEHIKSLGIILKLTEIATKNLSLKDFCREIIEVIIQETDFDNSSILLYDESLDSLKLIAASGSTSVIIIDPNGVEEMSFNKKLTFSRDNSIAWKVFESQEPYFIEDVNSHPFFKKSETTVSISSLFCLPLGEKGVLNLSTSIPKRLSTYQKRDLIIISQLIQKLLSLNNFVERLKSSHLLIQSLIEGKKLDLKQISQKDIDSFWGMESALLCAPQGIALIEENIITLVNPSLITLLNEKSDLVGRDINHTCLNHIFQSLLEEEELYQIHQKEFQLNIHPDKIIFVEAFLHHLQISSNNKKIYLLFLHDISHQKEITKRLIELEKKEIFSELSSGFAHHFNNILAVMIANIEMAMRDTNLDSIKKRLEKLIEPIGYAQHLIKNIQLVSAKPNINLDENNSLVTDINNFIDEVISITSVKWLDEAQKLGKTIEFSKDIKESAILKINPEHLRNVLINLIINSVDAINQKGIITIRFYTKDERGFIEVIDNGVGISSDDLEKIFSPFFTTKGMKSSGLGLTVSKEIMKGYNGDLLIRSKKNYGTTATIIIPLATKVDDVKKISLQQKKEVDKKSVKILYVDDEEGIINTITEMFAIEGFNVISTTSSQEALNIINNEKVDILITDLGMPVYNGFEIASYCRKKNPNCYIILATGWGVTINDDYKSKGIDTILNKPYRYDQLKEKILNSGKF